MFESSVDTARTAQQIPRPHCVPGAEKNSADLFRFHSYLPGASREQRRKPSELSKRLGMTAAHATGTARRRASKSGARRTSKPARSTRAASAAIDGGSASASKQHLAAGLHIMPGGTLRGPTATDDDLRHLAAREESPRRPTVAERMPNEVQASRLPQRTARSEEMQRVRQRRPQRGLLRKQASSAKLSWPSLSLPLRTYLKDRD